ncbi:hypothetical protein N9L68_04585 [bacterium]|nr:hypothetical protein [bacterium]
MGKQWCKVISAQGLVYAAVIDAQNAEHNQDPDEVIRFNQHETAFMRLFPFLMPNTIQLIEYHFQQFKMKESALPFECWMIPDLSPNTKPSRSNAGPLWQQIRSPGKEKLQDILHSWIQREIYTSLRNMKDWKRKHLNNQVDLNAKAKGRHVCRSTAIGHRA